MVHIVAGTPDGVKHSARVELKAKDQEATVQHTILSHNESCSFREQAGTDPEKCKKAWLIQLINYSLGRVN